MAPTDERIQDEVEEVGGEEFISPDDVYVEVADDGDQPMDDEDGDELGDLPEGSHPDQDDIVWEDNSIQHFPEHRKSVFAVAAHPTAPIAASGGEDDLGYLWDITTGETIVKLTGHTDSVAAVAFSSDGEMVATGGMDGHARVWKRRGTENYKTWEFVTDLQGPDEVMVRLRRPSVFH